MGSLFWFLGMEFFIRDAKKCVTPSLRRWFGRQEMNAGERLCLLSVIDLFARRVPEGHSQSPFSKFRFVSHLDEKIGEKIKIRSPQQGRCGLIIRKVHY
jgi:hypothetical protein